MVSPRISVITPSFNQAEFIRQTIESVLAQGYSNFEHIVVDGGSTDGTVDILRSYPHLSWTSEPDEGQTDALNKGFGRACGDIIAWLNADDSYAPGAFETVIQAMQSYPVVMGMCQMTDRDGQPTDVIENVEHTWFDLLKYWVYDSIPTQPTIFFTRPLLEQVKRADGSYLDSSLHYVMDYDLWLRMARLFPFNHRVDKVLANYRMYDTNKTSSGNWDLIFKEASRVFARYARDGSEQRLAFVVPLSEVAGRPDRSGGALDDLNVQSLSDFEVLLTADAVTASHRATVSELQRRYPRVAMRLVRGSGDQLADSFRTGLREARADVIVAVAPGGRPRPGLSLWLANSFANDALGASTVGYPETTTLTAASASENVEGTLDRLIRQTAAARIMAVRKVALADAGHLNERVDSNIAAAELNVKLLNRGWHIGIDDPRSEDAPSPTLTQAVRNEVIARLIIGLNEEGDREPFARLRTKHDAAIRLPGSVVASARDALDRAEAHEEHDHPG